MIPKIGEVSLKMGCGRYGFLGFIKLVVLHIYLERTWDSFGIDMDWRLFVH